MSDDQGAAMSAPSAPEPAKMAAKAAALGSVLAVVMGSPRHARMTMEEFANHVAPAVEKGQFSLLTMTRKTDGTVTAAAAAWWAMVSPEVESKLSSTRELFVKLTPEEWTSGPQPWIIDCVGEPAAVNELIKQLIVRNFTNPAAKMRATLPDGRVVVGKLEPRPAQRTGETSRN